MRAEPAKRTPSIGAVVVTRDRLEQLKECVAAVRRQSLPVAGAVVVNNASEDGTAEWLAAQPDVTAVHQGDEGLAGGLHTGLRRALDDGYDAIWLLDDDALPADDALERLVHAPANTGDNVVGSLVVSPENPEILSFQVPKLSSYSKLFDHYRVLTDRVADVRAESGELGYPWGMFVNSTLFPRAVVEAIGLPKREFYLGGEEIEYFYRVRSHGFGTYLVLDSICRHPKRAGLAIPRSRQQALVRNTVYTHRRYRRWFALRTARRLLAYLVTGRLFLIRPLWHGIRGDFSHRY